MGATSYIPTTGATATRLEDVITVTVPTGLTELIETIDGVELAPQVVVPATTYQIPEGNINSIKMNP